MTEFTFNRVVSCTGVVAVTVYSYFVVLSNFPLEDLSVCVCQMQGICESLFLVADIRFFMTLVMAVALAGKAL